MPYWNGYHDGCPQWYGFSDKLIEGSVEPSGLQIYARLTSEEWNAWILEFKEKATITLGYEIGELEDGYEYQKKFNLN